MNNTALISYRGHAPLNQRFGRYVYLNLDNGCWEWRGAKNEHGYGVIGKEGGRGAGNIKAHRLSYQIFRNNDLTAKECVCHECDNPACVNPGHLFVGSQLDNIADMLSKGRNSKPPIRYGESNKHAKLTTHDIIVIRNAYQKGFSSRKIGKQFSVTHSSILAIINRKSWRHV